MQNAGHLLGIHRSVQAGIWGDLFQFREYFANKFFGRLFPQLRYQGGKSSSEFDKLFLELRVRLVPFPTGAIKYLVR